MIWRGGGYQISKGVDFDFCLCVIYLLYKLRGCKLMFFRKYFVLLVGLCAYDLGIVFTRGWVDAELVIVVS